MTELYVFCEGPTERGFCKQVLGPHLWKTACYIHTILIGHSGTTASSTVAVSESTRPCGSTSKAPSSVRRQLFFPLNDN